MLLVGEESEIEYDNPARDALVPAKKPLIDVVHERPVHVVGINDPVKVDPVIPSGTLLSEYELVLFATIMLTLTVLLEKTATRDPLNVYPVEPSVAVGLV
jgi:hypothetical protein